MTLDHNAIRRVLVIRLKPVGDVLLATSYLRALRESFPQAQVDFCVFKPFDQILNRNPNLSEVLSFRPSDKPDFFFRWVAFIWRIRRRHYDLVIDQHGGTGSSQIVFFMGARYRLGWESGRYARLYNLKARRGRLRYEAAKNFDMVAPLGIEEQPVDLFYHVEPESYQMVDSWFREQGLDPAMTVCLSPGGRARKRMWKTAHYSGLADLIQQNTPYRVVVIWAPDELECARRMVEMCDSEPLLLPATTLNQAAALLTRIRLLVCHNCGLMHLSVATRTPNIAVFGPTGTGNWSPQGVAPDHWHLCNPAWVGSPDNDFGVTAEDAFAKVQQVLGNAEAP